MNVRDVIGGTLGLIVVVLLCYVAIKLGTNQSAGAGATLPSVGNPDPTDPKKDPQKRPDKDETAKNWAGNQASENAAKGSEPRANKDQDNDFARRLANLEVIVHNQNTGLINVVHEQGLALADLTATVSTKNTGLDDLVHKPGTGLVDVVNDQRVQMKELVTWVAGAGNVKTLQAIAAKEGITPGENVQRFGKLIIHNETDFDQKVDVYGVQRQSPVFHSGAFNSATYNGSRGGRYNQARGLGRGASFMVHWPAELHPGNHHWSREVER